MPDALDLSLIVPVHNEGATIAASLARWRARLSQEGLRAECLVIDDGSTDDTPRLLADLAGTDPGLRVIRQSQAGHGAAVAAGYRAARGAWVLQIDGDDEIGPDYFGPLWAGRLAGGLVLGRRDPATRAAVRRAVTRMAARYVRVVSGVSLADPNVPFRLLPRERLHEFLGALPPATFAPNLAMAIYAGRRAWPLREVAVIERARSAARRPLGGARLWRAVFLVWRQSASFARQIRRQSTRS